MGARHLLRVFQVSYQGAVAKEAASQVLDLRGVVCSVSNGEDLAFLHPLKRRKPSSKPELACEACGRFVRKGGSYCSISCKLEVIQRQEILAVMHSPRGTVLKLQAGDGFAGEAASLLPTAAAAMVSAVRPAGGTQSHWVCTTTSGRCGWYWARRVVHVKGAAEQWFMAQLQHWVVFEF